MPSVPLLNCSAAVAESSTSKGFPPTLAVNPATLLMSDEVMNIARSSQWIPSQTRWPPPERDCWASQRSP